jgi:hypothetical protein
MEDASEQPTSVRQSALQLALKEVLAQQHYAGVVPIAPDYQLVARRAQEIEQALRESARQTRRQSATP